MSKQPKKGGEKKSTSDDPSDFKQGASGILILIAVCGVLWLIASFGPRGADWLNAQTRKISGISTEKMTKVSSPPTPKAKDKQGDKSAEPKIDPVKESEVASKVEEAPVEKSAPVVAVETPATPDDDARQQIQEALGGPEIADVRYIAFSDDQAKMIAAVKFLKSENPTKFVEIVFTRDEFGWYRSDIDTPNGETIIVRQSVATK